MIVLLLADVKYLRSVYGRNIRVCPIISACVCVRVCVCLLISLPQITGNGPNVCAKSHVAKRERDVERNRGSLKEGA